VTDATRRRTARAEWSGAARQRALEQFSVSEADRCLVRAPSRSIRAPAPIFDEASKPRAAGRSVRSTNGDTALLKKRSLRVSWQSVKPKICA
jgi:hypothetical protein